MVLGEALGVFCDEEKAHPQLEVSSAVRVESREQVPNCRHFGGRRVRVISKLGLGFDELVAEGEADEVANAAEFHFAHHAVAVAFHCAGGNAHVRRDLAVLLTAGYPGDDFALFFGEDDLRRLRRLLGIEKMREHLRKRSVR